MKLCLIVDEEDQVRRLVVGAPGIDAGLDDGERLIWLPPAGLLELAAECEELVAQQTRELCQLTDDAPGVVAGIGVHVRHTREVEPLLERLKAWLLEEPMRRAADQVAPQEPEEAQGVAP